MFSIRSSVFVSFPSLELMAIGVSNMLFHLFFSLSETIHVTELSSLNTPLMDHPQSTFNANFCYARRWISIIKWYAFFLCNHPLIRLKEPSKVKSCVIIISVFLSDLQNGPYSSTVEGQEYPPWWRSHGSRHTPS